MVFLIFILMDIDTATQIMLLFQKVYFGKCQINLKNVLVLEMTLDSSIKIALELVFGLSLY